MKLELRKDQKYLLAVSGGIDSMVLCDLFVKYNLQFSVAHCNFQLRGEESDGDELLVANWCTQNHIPFFVKKFDTKHYADQNKLSIQVAARNLRYDFFYEIIETEKINCIVTAHHQDDNIETVLFHFFRGTGIAGLTGIPAENDKIIRPLLGISKKEITAYAIQNNIAYREDSSNKKIDYTRNKLRNNLIPQLEEVIPNFKNNIAQNILRLSEAHEIYQQQIHTYRKKLLETRGKDSFIPILKLKKLRPLPTILYEILKPFDFNFSQTEQAILLLESETGRYIENEKFRILKNRNFLIVSEKSSLASEIILIHPETDKISMANFDLKIQTISKNNFQLKTENDFCQLDAELLEYPLILRKWQQGDYMYPLGMKKKKKISRIFIDQKIPGTEKEKTWVLESNKKIVWLVGLKIDERFKVMEKTKNIKIIQHIK
jgi:tRNA(Ile)-lysidine synthase